MADSDPAFQKLLSRPSERSLDVAPLRFYHLKQPSVQHRDPYQSAITQLADKIGETISQEDYDSFVNGNTCTTVAEARDLLFSVQDDFKQVCKKSSFHRFLQRLNAFFDPLRLFKDALDTLCQVETTCCLIWGSLKVLIQVSFQTSLSIDLCQC